MYSISNLMDQAAAYNERLPKPKPQPELPEFHFSEKAIFSKDLLDWDPRFQFAKAPTAPIRIIGKPGPSMPRTLGKEARLRRIKAMVAHTLTGAAPVTDTEIRWMNYQQNIPGEIHSQYKAEYGTTKPYIPGSYATKEQELAFLIESQGLDLQTVEAEIRQAGLDLMRRHRDGDDDVDDFVNESVQDNTVYVQPDRDLLARIDWEKSVTPSGFVTKVHYDVIDGQLAITSNLPSKKLSPQEIADVWAPRLKALKGERKNADMINAIARARHYKALVLAEMPPRHTVREAYQHYLDFADDNIARTIEKITEDEDIIGVPNAEIGLHFKGQHLDNRHIPMVRKEIHDDIFEPTELEMWPLTEKEIRYGITPFEAVAKDAAKALISFTNRIPPRFLHRREGMKA